MEDLGMIILHIGVQLQISVYKAIYTYYIDYYRSMIRRILDALLYKEEVKPYDRIEPFENNVKYMYSDTQVDPNTIDGLTKM